MFLNCNKKSTSDSIKAKNENIDILLTKSYDAKLSKNLRIKYADELYSILKVDKNDSLHRYYYFKLSDRYYNLKEYDKYISVCRDLNQLSEESKDSANIAKSLQYIGDYHY